MATQRKIDAVADLTSKLSKAKSVILADYRGLKHKQMEELRKLLKKSQAEFVVAKNRLFKRALGEKFSSLKDSLQNTTAILFAYADEVSPLKELLKYFKSAGAGKIKAGLLGKQTLSESDLARLATLPSREVLLGKLAGRLNAPIQGLHYALSWNLRKFVYAIEQIRAIRDK